MADGELCACQMGKAQKPPFMQMAPGGYPAQNVQGMPGQPGSAPGANGAMQGAPQEQQYAYQQQEQQYAYQQQVQQQYQQVQKAVSGHFATTIGTFFNMIKSPVVTGRQLIAYADMGVIVTLILIQAVASGLFDIAVMAKMSSVGMGYVKMPFGRSFFVTLLASSALSFLLAALLLAGNRILKNMVSFQQMLACVAVRSVLLAVTSVIAMIVFILFPVQGFFLYLAGSLWGMLAIAMVMPKNINGRDDGLVLMQFLAAVLFLILFVIAIRLCWKAYVPDAISALGNGLDSLFQNPSAVLQDIF